MERLTTQAWKRRAEWPLTVAAVAFLVSYSVEVLVPGLPRGVRLGLRVVDLLTWALFVVDYVVQVALAPQRLRHVLRHIPDLLVVLLPLLRPLRLLRLLVLLRYLDRGAIRTLQGRVAAYVVLATVLVLYSGTLAGLDAERDAPGSTITTFGTALWWALTTITTVGYGDVYPVTTQGRVVAGVLMVAGVALLGAVTATLSSTLVARVTADGPRRTDRPLASATSDLEAEVARLRSLLEGHGIAVPGRAPDEPGG